MLTSTELNDDVGLVFIPTISERLMSMTLSHVASFLPFWERVNRSESFMFKKQQRPDTVRHQRLASVQYIKCVFSRQIRDPSAAGWPALYSIEPSEETPPVMSKSRTFARLPGSSDKNTYGGVHIRDILEGVS